MHLRRRGGDAGAGCSGAHLPRARLRTARLSIAISFWRFTVSTLFLVAGLWMVRQLASGPERAASQVASLALAIGVAFLIEGAGASPMEW